MESESHFNEDAVSVQERDLSKVEGANRSPNFELRETMTFINEDNFDDGCSSTTGASGCRDSSVSPHRFSNNENETGSEGACLVESDINRDDLQDREVKDENNREKNDVSREIYAFESDFGSSDLQVPTLNTYIQTDDNAKKQGKEDSSALDGAPEPLSLGEDQISLEFLYRQKALDRANVFLRWNLLPTRTQVNEFLEMAQGKLNISMVSEKGYDYCLLYFELLRDGLIGYHLWGDVTPEQIEASISEARQTLANALTPPQVNKRRNPDDAFSEENSGSYGSDKVPLHYLASTKRRNQNGTGDGYSELQGISMTSLNFTLNDKNEGNEGAGTSVDSLEWQRTNGSCRDSDTSNSNIVDDSLRDSNPDLGKEDNDSDIEDNLQENEGSSSSRQDAMNRLLNPKSGCKGVSWSNRQMAWLAFWKEDNQRRSKTFSARKLGFEEAQRRAIEFLRRKREEVRMKTQAHLYEELPRVGSTSLNPSNESQGVKTPNRRSYPNSNATTTATPATPVIPSFELDQFATANQFIPCFEESTRSLMAGANPLFGATSNILAANSTPMISHTGAVQQGVIQPGMSQQNLLSAAASRQLGLPFHLAALSSITGGIQMDPSLSATVAAAAGLGLGMQSPQQPHQAGAPPLNNFAHAALMAANPFFMFGAAAAAAAAGSGSGQLGPSSPGPHFPFQQFPGHMGGSLTPPASQLQQDRENSSGSSRLRNHRPAAVLSKTGEQGIDVSADNNASNATMCTTAEGVVRAFETQAKPEDATKTSLKMEVGAREDIENTLTQDSAESVSKSESGGVPLKALANQVPPLEV